jgi:alpha-glucosidase
MGQFAVDTQDGVEGSTLTMYRRALAIRKTEAGLGDGPMEWIEAGKDVVAFKRPGNFACYINFGAALELPSGSEILIISGPISGHTLPTDTAAWVRLVS